MEQIYILNMIYTSENNCYLNKDTSEMYPQLAGSQRAIERQLNIQIESLEEKGYTIEELTSSDVHKGTFFDRVVKAKKDDYIVIYGICHVHKAYDLN